MKDNLEMIDILGTKFNFNINQKQTFKTPLGGFFTIIIIGIVVFFSFFFGLDFYYKTNPLIFTSTIVPDRYDDPLLLTPENLVIAWRIENYDGTKIDFDKVIYPVQIENYFKKNENDTFEIIYQREMHMRKCDKSNAKMREFTDFNKLDDWYCFDWTDGNKTFGGFWDGDYVIWYQLYLYLCDKGIEYSSSNPNCTKMEDYWKFETENGGGVAISIMYPEYYFSAEDSVDPLRITYKNFYYYLSPRTFKIDRFFFNKITLFDDQGWIFEDTYSKTLLSFNKIGDDQNINDIVDGKSSKFYEANLYIEKASIIIKRSYLKIQDVGAKVGGIIKVILLIFVQLNSFFSKYKLNLSIFSQLFDFNSKDRNEYDQLKEG